MIATRLQQINKPAVKTIQSPDGDIIDCVLTHEQLAFDHPLLKGQKLLDPPETLIEHNQIGNSSDVFQLWSLSGESCPEGTIPIRRITEQDMLRAGSIRKFGKKYADRSKHEHAIVSVEGDGYTGAKASLNVWAPKVESRYEFSLAQIWMGSKDSETIEAGWQVCRTIYGDDRPRLFIYYTVDNYGTGCYNLKCSGFVQTNRKIVLGGSIAPISVYNGRQFDITLKIEQHAKTGDWWLVFGNGNIVGYWPASLFRELKGEAYYAHFGGEVLNLRSRGSHTTTQMGSGHFDTEGYGKAAYIRNIQVAVNSPSIWIDLPEPEYTMEKENCYALKGRYSKGWGNYIYFGGPGKNEDCP
ncbi:hypothetical protein P8452_69826 [Trifolium repens]|nr:hypothetical protein QL285_043441 [Trifolium repens]WJX87661.1 hypothetical protein P8452_69826 [Trifolium repens]